MKAGALLNNLAAKAGIKSDDTALIGILSKAEFADTEIPDAIATVLEGGLMNLENAKNNIQLKNHFTALALAPLDADVERILAEIQLDATTQEEIKAEKSTYKKIPLLTQKIKEAEEAKSKAAGKGDTDKVKEYQDKINAFAQEKQRLLQEKDAAVQQAEQKANETIASMAKKMHLSGLPYASKDIPLEANINNADFFISKQAAQDGVKIKFDHTTEQFKLVQAADENLDYVDPRGNKPSYEDYSKGILIQNKLIDVVDASKKEPSQQRKEIVDDTSAASKNSFFAAVDAAISDVQTS